jgi:hypothetical protein
MQQEAKGRGLLKTSGILLIIFGSLAALGLIAYLVIIGFIAAIAGVNGDNAAGFGFFAVFYTFFLLLAAFSIVTGGIGIHNSKRPQHCVSCLVMGIVVLVFVLFFVIYFLVEDMIGFSMWIFIVGALICIVLPALYVSGAALNLSSRKKE